MATVVFDTLILSRKLAATGMPTDQAQGVAAAIAETLGEQIVTQRDLTDLHRDIQHDFAGLDRRLAALETRPSTAASLAVLSPAVDARFALCEARLIAAMRVSERRLTTRLGAIVAASAVLAGVLAKLL